MDWPKRMKFDPNTTITTGMEADVERFQWRIQNFDSIRYCKELVESQHIILTLGSGVGLPCKWKFFLMSMTELVPHSNSNESGNDSNEQQYTEINWLEIRRTLVETPTKRRQRIYNSYHVQIHTKRGYLFMDKIQDAIGSLRNERRCMTKVLKLNDDIESLPLIDGHLVIDITFTTFAPTSLQTRNNKAISNFNVESTTGLSSDHVKLLKQPTEFPFSDVEIISKDGRKFPVHWTILAARSPVFRAMASTAMNERRTGMIHIDDVGGEALDLLLQYIYGGIVSNEWFQPQVIYDLTYLAGKYELTDLLKFLDSTIGTRCGWVNCAQLLDLCGKLDLKTAERELLSNVKINLISTATNIDDLSNFFDTNSD